VIGVRIRFLVWLEVVMDTYFCYLRLEFSRTVCDQTYRLIGFGGGKLKDSENAGVETRGAKKKHGKRRTTPGEL